MPKKLQSPKQAPKHAKAWPEAFVSDASIAVAVSRAVDKGQLRKLAPRVYTSNLTDAPETIIRRNLWLIVGGLVPDGLIADRTALENGPASDGSLFLVSADRFRDIALPGITVKVRQGTPPLESDRPFIGGLRLSATARAYLDNMALTKTRQGQASRTLDKTEMEQRLETALRLGGVEALNRLRDEARLLAPLLGRETEMGKLDTLIGGLLGTREAILSSPTARARQTGFPYDPARLSLFEALHQALRTWPLLPRPAPLRTSSQSAVFAFFEAYFSNFIEGTEFAIEEAMGIVFEGRIPEARPADAHDVLGTYRLAVDTTDSRKIPATPEALLEILRHRHASIMAGRPETEPGQFKRTSNRASGVVFVAPELVTGTLHQGFALYQSLETPLQRAIFMMFLVAEVHPFIDGNGRTARLMMNAELSAAGEERIIIPTVYRNNYLAALSVLSNHAHPEPLIRTLDFAHKWTAMLQIDDLENTRSTMTICNAFMNPNRADEMGVRLILPSRKADY